MTLGELYPDDATFTNIGDDSEQTHTDTVRDILAIYGMQIRTRMPISCPPASAFSPARNMAGILRKNLNCW